MEEQEFRKYGDIIALKAENTVEKIPQSHETYDSVNKYKKTCSERKKTFCDPFKFLIMSLHFLLIYYLL